MDKKTPDCIFMSTEKGASAVRDGAWLGDYGALPPVLTTTEAAAIARRSRRTIVRACEAGRIKAVKVGGGLWNVGRDSLLEYAGLLAL